MNHKIHLPVLDCQSARKFEEKILTTAPLVSAAIGDAAKAVYCEVEGEFNLSAAKEILILAGGGHNGADALTLAEILAKKTGASITVLHAQKERLKPATLAALEALERISNTRAITFDLTQNIGKYADKEYDFLFEGLAAMSFVPPLRPELAQILECANKISARVKVAIDMPAGIGQDEVPLAFAADATYATGIAKAPLLEKFNRKYAGRVRLAQIPLFERPLADVVSQTFVTRADALSPFENLRPSECDKRFFGHLFIIAGSCRYPGAALLNVKAALRSGCGLVTACVPKTFAPALAAAEPSAIWIGCEEDETGAIALESYSQIAPLLPRATALLTGSGISRSAETNALLREIAKNFPALPLVLDADAFCENILTEASRANPERPIIATPHEGEFGRIAKDVSEESLLGAAERFGACIVLKSSLTRISDGKSTVYSPHGSPALARAGSGDILSGLTGGLLAQSKNILRLYGDCRPIDIASLAAQLHGLAGERAARQLGENFLASSDILRFLNAL